MVKKRKRGVMFLLSFGFIMVSLVFSSFAWDTARIMYLKVHNLNVASTVAISIVNESSHYLSNSLGTDSKGYLVTRYYTKGKLPKGFSGAFADDFSFAMNIFKKNDIGGPDRDFEIVYMDVNNNYNDMPAFLVGQDGKNGDVYVKTVMNIKLFFPKLATMFGMPVKSENKVITNVAWASATFTKTSETIQEGQKEEFVGYIPYQ